LIILLEYYPNGTLSKIKIKLSTCLKTSEKKNVKMRKLNQFRKTMTLILSVTALFILSSCVQGTGAGRAKATAKSGLSAGAGAGAGSGAVDSGTGSGTTTLFTQQVELSHLVDPFDGTYKKKLTIPKNFKGNLYLAGLNVSSLSNKLISVRFKFGTDKQAVTLKATVGRAPGIVPNTDIQVLMIDMNSKPFARMRLGYDLYDYNDYITDPTKEIVTNPRDGGLYCRGLKLEDDPTFTALNTNSTCSSTTDKCLYSYAKIVDSTLYTTTGANTVSSIPTRSQVWTESSGVRNPTVASLATNVCLPDDSTAASIDQLFDINFASLGSAEFPIFGVAGSGIYRGPYRSINDSEWQISSSAVYNSSTPVTFGLFQQYPLIGSMITGYHSMLFPRAGKLSLNQGVSYLGSTDRIGSRSKMLSDSTGTSNYVDGCNLRVINYDPASSEGINSCNVNASIEIFYMLDGQEVSIAIDKTIKLQLIRPSLTNFEGNEVLTSAFKRCESSSTCGSDECCFNSRCWSKDLVTQCVDQTPGIGNQEIGANCSSDFECSSLCCNQSTGACSPHNPNGANPIFCSKTSGQQCVSQDFCQQVAVVTCKIVKAGFKPDGSAKCDLRCPAVMTYGDCRAGTCVPPVQPAVPAFDPNDCSQAVDP
jgi:hypothetical protein